MTTVVILALAVVGARRSTRVARGVARLTGARLAGVSPARASFRENESTFNSALAPGRKYVLRHPPLDVSWQVARRVRRSKAGQVRTFWSVECNGQVHAWASPAWWLMSTSAMISPRGSGAIIRARRLLIRGRL